MKVLPANNLSFGKVYREEAGYTNKQLYTIDVMKQALNSQYQMRYIPLEHTTYNQLIESYGYDILLTQGKERGKIAVGALKNFKFNDKTLAPEKDEMITRLPIGEYDETIDGQSFIDDVVKTVQKRRKYENNVEFAAKLIALIVAGLAVGFTMSIPFWGRVSVKKPAKEQSQQILNKVNTFAKDTAKTFIVK